MAEMAGEQSDRKWKFATSFMSAGLLLAGSTLVLLPTMMNASKEVPNTHLDWLLPAGILSVCSSLTAFAYGFVPRREVGLAALGLMLASAVVYFASKVGACAGIAALILIGRGSYQLYKSQKAMKPAALNPSPPAPPSLSA